MALIGRSGGKGFPWAEHGFSRRAVECIVLPEWVIEADCRTVGRLARGLLRDGVALTGRWDRSLPATGVCMDVADSISLLETTIRRFKEGVDGYGALEERRSWHSDDSACNAFVRRTADAAERSGKALLIGLGLDPVERYSMDAFVEQARRAGFSGQAGWLADLNGSTHLDRMADYFGEAKATTEQ